MNKKLSELLVITLILLLTFMLSEVEAEKAGEKDWKEDWEWKGKWVEMTSGTGKDLRAVSGGSKTDIIAAGLESTLLYYDGDDDRKKDLLWQPLLIEDERRKLKKLDLNELNLYAVWGNSEKNVLAVGQQGVIIFGYKGVHWSIMTNPVQANLNGIWGSSWKDVFAVGSNGTILHYDGDGNNDDMHDDIWEQKVKPDEKKKDLYGIWGSSPDNVFAVGDGNTVLHYDGNEWTPIEKQKLLAESANENFRAVWGSSWKDVFVVGSNGTILHYDGDGNNDDDQDDIWEVMESGTTNQLNAIYGNSPSNVFAVGNGNTVLHYNGKTWKTVKDFPDLGTDFNAVWLSPNPDHVFIMGGDGKIIRGQQQHQDAYWVDGYVYDIHDDSPITGVKVDEMVGGQPNLKDTTDSDGYFGPIDFNRQNPTLRFSDGSTPARYKTETRDVKLEWEALIPVNTFLLKTSELYRISGVISKVCQSSGNAYYCPLEGVTVNLHKDSGNYNFSPTSTCSTQTDSKGRYSFPNQEDCSNLPAGLYQIKAVEPNCQFSDRYQQIPQNSPPVAHDFSGTSTGAGECQCDIDCP